MTFFSLAAQFSQHYEGVVTSEWTLVKVSGILRKYQKLFQAVFIVIIIVSRIFLVVVVNLSAVNLCFKLLLAIL